MTLQRLLKGIVLPVFLLIGLAAMAQETILVSGKVSDSKDGSPLIGVSVSVKGTSSGTATDGNGNFSLKVSQGATLVFTYVGFGTKEVAAAPNMQVSLEGAKTALNDVVVIGYGTARKKDLTGAVATVTQKDFQKGNITTPEQMLAGKVAGVQITNNDGRPGSGSTIRIRGGASLNASNDPLIVIDGVPLDNGGINGAANPLSFINANDVESFTVLKDASAAAIYGSRANNGVIIITTKKGRTGKLRVLFNSMNSISTVAKKVPMLTGDEVRGLVNVYGSPAQKALLTNESTDWQDQVLRSAFSTDNNLSLTGGLGNLPFRANVGYTLQQGLLSTDELRRINVSLALSKQLFDKHLKIDVNLKGSSQDTRFADGGALGGALSFDPTKPVRSGKGRYGGYFEWLDAQGLPFNVAARNPVALLNMREDRAKPMRSIGNIQLDYKFHFLPELRANVNFGYDAAVSKTNNLVSDSAALRYLQGGEYSQGKQERWNPLFDFYLNYAKDLRNIKSRVDATVGYSYARFNNKFFNYRTLKANKDTIPNTLPPVFPFSISENSIISYFGRLLFNYDSKYFLTATLRRDGSSRFSPENRWGWFPSIGVSWDVRREFFENSNFISDLKLRGGWGLTGQQDGIGNYDYLGRYVLGGNTTAYQFGNGFVLPWEPLGFNGALKWEVLKSANVAVDFGLFDGRLTGSIDLYDRQSSDLLARFAQPAGTNFSAFITGNVGALTNRGAELALTAKVIDRKDFRWEVSGNATYNRNTIDRLSTNNDPSSSGLPVGFGSGFQGGIQRQQIGYTRNTFYTYQQIYGADGRPVEGLFEDRNRDGIITDADRYYNKSAVGDWFFGLSSNVSYKRFSAGFVARASLNNYVYNNVASDLGRLANVVGVSYQLSNAHRSYFSTGFRGGNDIALISDHFVENASFIRLDNLFFGYDFGAMLGKDSRFSANITIQNLFIISKYSGIDPEVNGGVDRNIYPRPRVFGVSLVYEH